jgi:hypothetical protein
MEILWRCLDRPRRDLAYFPIAHAGSKVDQRRMTLFTRRHRCERGKQAAATGEEIYAQGAGGLGKTTLNAGSRIRASRRFINCRIGSSRRTRCVRQGPPGPDRYRYEKHTYRKVRLREPVYLLEDPAAAFVRILLACRARNVHYDFVAAEERQCPGWIIKGVDWF